MRLLDIYGKINLPLISTFVTHFVFTGSPNVADLRGLARIDNSFSSWMVPTIVDASADNVERLRSPFMLSHIDTPAERSVLA